MKKSFIILSFLLFTIVRAYAQNDFLSDLEPGAGLPDFSNFVKGSEKNENITPELPIESCEADKKSEKSVFSEIYVGGGYPFLVYGDCSVFGVKKGNPFKFSFKYDGANGYNGKSFNDNYSDRFIDLSFEKKFKNNNLKWDFLVEYNSISNGLQNQAENITENNQNLFMTHGNINYDFENGIFINGNLDLDIYNRYANSTDSLEAPDWIKKTLIFNVNPAVTVGWAGYGFQAFIKTDYLMYYDIFNSLSGGNNNRCETLINFQWSNDIFTTYSNVGIILGNKLKGSSVFFPFNLGFNLTFPVTFANRKVNVSAEGGLDSYYNSINDLETKYKFVTVPVIPEETSDWYCKINIDVPVKSSFTGNAYFEYRETAFDKGIWEPKFSDSNFINGLYAVREKNHKMLTTDFSLTYHHKLFSFSGGLHSNWLDVPVLKFIQTVRVNLSMQDENSKWGASLFGTYSLTSLWTTPIINLDCFVQISPKVRFTAFIGDLIPVFNSKERDYGGKYIDRGFEAGVFLKFVL